MKRYDLSRTEEAKKLISKLEYRNLELDAVKSLQKQEHIMILHIVDYKIKGDTKDKILSLVEEDLIKEIEEIENKLKEI